MTCVPFKILKLITDTPTSGFVREMKISPIDPLHRFWSCIFFPEQPVSYGFQDKRLIRMVGYILYEVNIIKIPTCSVALIQNCIRGGGEG